ncbi:hypothetical protein D3C81_921550 [compost metagenome]
MKKTLVIVSLLLMVALTACGDGLPDTYEAVKDQETSVYKPYADLGDNIFWIRAMGIEYVNSLKVLLNDHPELKLVDTEGDGSESHGRNTGFYIIMEEK